jgi:VanZ family protein
MHTKQINKIFWPLLLLAYSAMIYFASSKPIEIPGPGFPAKDKLLHLIAYAALAWLAWQTVKAWSLRHPGEWAWLYAAGYGATDEWHQYFVPGRQCDLWDWVADAVGAAMVILVVTRHSES